MTLVFVPGFMADRTLWEDMIPHLGPADQMEFADLNTGNSIATMAEAILAKAPPSFVLIGFSMGGYVARAIYRMAPERVRALVLIATSARGDAPELRQSKQAAMAQLTTGKFNGLSRASIMASLHPDREQDQRLFERVKSMGLRLGDEVFARQAAVQRDGDMHLLSGIRCPTLVIAADGDRLRSVEEARELASHIPGSEMQVIENSGHMIPLEAPLPLAAAITCWLKKTMPPTEQS